MKRVYIKDIKPGKPGENTKSKVSGFVENLRDAKSMSFLVVKDITGKLQVTIEKGKCAEIDEAFAKLTPDSIISITGIVNENDFVQLNGREMIPDSIEILSVAEALPIARKEIAGTKKKKAVERSSIDQRLDYRWIDLRTDENQLLFKVQTLLQSALRNYLSERNFVEIHSPKLIASASESGATVFELEYFDGKAYLAQSPQFYKQMAMAAGFERVFEFGPVFRAEKSYTSKHATEFTGFDIEMSYINNYRDIMNIQQEMLAYAFGIVKEKYGDMISELFGIEMTIPTLPFPEIRLEDLFVELEREFGFILPDDEKGDLT
ncbi:MAG: OB-fold nucleic acid binding domain-containing protein, partial [Defluviitaleaceae bacterium]|nr:OB-fold nucleic acid binding domain-containing protein [Defluviitaleaceae bacterium]